MASSKVRTIGRLVESPKDHVHCVAIAAATALPLASLTTTTSLDWCDKAYAPFHILFPKDKHPKHDDRFGNFLEVNSAEYFVPETHNLSHQRDEAGIRLFEDKMGVF